MWSWTDRGCTGPLFRYSDDRKMHYVQMGVGHYGVFNGTHWRTQIQPKIHNFIQDAVDGGSVVEKKKNGRASKK